MSAKNVHMLPPCPLIQCLRNILYGRILSEKQKKIFAFTARWRSFFYKKNVLFCAPCLRNFFEKCLILHRINFFRRSFWDIFMTIFLTAPPPPDKNLGSATESCRKRERQNFVYRMLIGQPLIGRLMIGRLLIAR